VFCAFRRFQVHAFRALNKGRICIKIRSQDVRSKMESIMQRAFLVVRSVGLSSLAGLGLILVLVFASNSFAVTTPWLNQQRKLKAAAAASAAREASAVDSAAAAAVPTQH